MLLSCEIFVFCQKKKVSIPNVSLVFLSREVVVVYGMMEWQIS